ncbi:MAG TPA: MarR family transcriptional regulator [Pyrinomonadaceae bacterium]|nr:MarR family transcriptional regulator [Pyrinomonadaceae bacterium]
MKNLDQVIFYKIEKSIRTYRQFAQRQIKNAGFAITIDQWLAIKTILENPGIKQQELAENIFKDNASITRIIELLVKAKYLKRKIHKHDRRRTELTVTKAGEEIVEKVNSVILQNREKALQGIGFEELELIDNLLQKITENCSE